MKRPGTGYGNTDIVRWGTMHWLLVLTLLAFPALASDTDLTSSLVLEARIPLGNVYGRIDHLAIDMRHQRLFVAELGNNSMGVIDLGSRKIIHQINGLHEPQGMGYVPATDTVYVANGGNGSVTMFQGTDLSRIGTINVGSDADNVHVDSTNHQVIVGYGNGGLAIIDALDSNKIDRIQLHAHPEGFQIDPSTHYVFVNIPALHEIDIVDAVHRSLLRHWALKNLSSNFPIAIDPQSKRLFTAFRHPAVLSMLDMKDGTVISTIAGCGDADDVFSDTIHSLVYVSCGTGYLDVFSYRENTLTRIDHIKTVSGARTALFVPELGRLFLAVRTTFTESAAIWVYRVR